MPNGGVGVFWTKGLEILVRHFSNHMDLDVIFLAKKETSFHYLMGLYFRFPFLLGVFRYLILGDTLGVSFLTIF